MKKLIIILALLPLCGCANVVTGINNTVGALTSPQATQALANLKAGTSALVCFVGGVSALTQDIATQVSAGNAFIHDASNVYVISSDICASLGGVVTGKASP